MRGPGWAAGEVASAWAASLIVMMAAAAAAGVPVFEAASYARYDSGHYLWIARAGYVLTTCRDVPAYAPEAWCGNAGWFPGYPLLIRGLSGLGFSPELTGLVVANGFALLCLALVRVLAGRLGMGAAAPALVFLAALFPGGLYGHAIFPISIVLACGLGLLLLVERGQLLAAALVGAVGAFFYSTGFLLSAVVGFGALIRGVGWPSPRRFAMAAGCGVVVLAGMGAVLALHQGEVGQWNAFFLVQAKMGHGLHNPFAVFPAMVATFAAALGAPDRMLAPAQTLIIGALVPAAVLGVLARYRTALALEWVVAVWALVFWLFPLVMGPAVSLTRAEALLMPMVLLLARLPRPGQLALLVLFAALRFQGGVAFFHAVLV